MVLIYFSLLRLKKTPWELSRPALFSLRTNLYRCTGGKSVEPSELPHSSFLLRLSNNHFQPSGLVLKLIHYKLTLRHLKLEDVGGALNKLRVFELMVLKFLKFHHSGARWRLIQIIFQ